jgi:hypothetical protein
MSSNFSDLISYFETLATKHKSIAHSTTEKHFFRMEIDEILAGIKRTDVQPPFLILEGYSFDFTDQRADNLFKNRNGAFVLYDFVSDKSDYTSIHEKWDELEEIATDIIVKIKADKRLNTIPVIGGFDFGSVQASLIMNEIGKGVGIRIQYSIGSPTSNDVDSDKWNE